MGILVDLPEPRNVEISLDRSKNLIRSAKDLFASMSGGGNGRDRGGDRESDSLDDTRSRQSSIPPNDSELRANDRRVQIPQWLLLFLLVQGGTIIWWAATTTSDLRYQEREKLRLETKIDNGDNNLRQEIKLYDVQRQKDVDRVRDQVRDEVANQLLSRGVIRIQTNNP